LGKEINQFSPTSPLGVGDLQFKLARITFHLGVWLNSPIACPKRKKITQKINHPFKEQLACEEFLF